MNLYESELQKRLTGLISLGFNYVVMESAVLYGVSVECHENEPKWEEYKDMSFGISGRWDSKGRKITLSESMLGAEAWRLTLSKLYSVRAKEFVSISKWLQELK